MPDLRCYRCRAWPCQCRDGQTIIHGDCREVLPLLEPVDLVLTDPPYGIGWDTKYSRFTRLTGGTYSGPIIANDDAPFNPTFLLTYKEVITWGANHYCQLLPAGSWLLWDKRSTDGTAFLSDGEIAWWSHGHGVYIKSINAQRHRTVQGGFHPTQKPIELMRWCIEKAKSLGTVLDPFLGSGTTLRACKDLGRRGIGIEIEERYCEIAANRLRQEVLF